MATKRGRPPIDPEKRVSEMVPVRMTQSERVTFQAVAERAGLSLSEWIRERLAKAAKRESKRD